MNILKKAFLSLLISLIPLVIFVNLNVPALQKLSNGNVNGVLLLCVLYFFLVGVISIWLRGWQKHQLFSLFAIVTLSWIIIYSFLIVTILYSQHAVNSSAMSEELKMKVLAIYQESLFKRLSNAPKNWFTWQSYNTAAAFLGAFIGNRFSKRKV